MRELFVSKRRVACIAWVGVKCMQEPVSVLVSVCGWDVSLGTGETSAMCLFSSLKHHELTLSKRP